MKEKKRNNKNLAFLLFGWLLGILTGLVTGIGTIMRFYNLI